MTFVKNYNSSQVTKLLATKMLVTKLFVTKNSSIVKLGIKAVRRQGKVENLFIFSP